MDYEKKYKETLERAKEKYSACSAPALLEYIFPELKEPNDERIRKALIEYFGEQCDMSDWNGIYGYQVLAWLEKQGEQHPHVDVNKMVDKFAHTEVKGYGVPSMIEVDAYRRGIEDAFEKQGGQTQLDYEHEELPKIDLEILFQALPAKIVDEKSHQVYELCVYRYDGQCVVDYVGEIDHDSLYTFGGDTLYDAMEKAWDWLRKNSTGG